MPPRKRRGYQNNYSRQHGRGRGNSRSYCPRQESAQTPLGVDTQYPGNRSNTCYSGTKNEQRHQGNSRQHRGRGRRRAYWNTQQDNKPSTSTVQSEDNKAPGIL